MILSILHLVLTIRAVLRCVSDRFVFGIVGGLARAALMMAGGIISVRQASLFMLPGITLRTSGSPTGPASAALGGAVTILGPIVSLALVGVSWRRFQDVPAAREEALRHPFDAWLPVAALDAIYVVISIGAVWFVEHP